MTFDDNVSEFTVRVVNTLNEKEKDITIPYAQLVIKELDKEDKLFGKQRLFSFYQQGSLMTRVNIDLTAWSRLENLEDLLLLLRKNTHNKALALCRRTIEKILYLVALKNFCNFIKQHNFKFRHIANASTLAAILVDNNIKPLKECSLMKTRNIFFKTTISIIFY